MSFDGADRPPIQTVSSGDKISTVSYAYDHQRLDQETLFLGGSAPDRVTKYGCDESDRRTTIMAGLGTAEQSSVKRGRILATGWLRR